MGSHTPCLDLVGLASYVPTQLRSISLACPGPDDDVQQTSVKKQPLQGWLGCVVVGIVYHQSLCHALRASRRFDWYRQIRTAVWTEKTSYPRVSIIDVPHCDQ